MADRRVAPYVATEYTLITAMNRAGLSPGAKDLYQLGRVWIASQKPYGGDGHLTSDTIYFICDVAGYSTSQGFSYRQELVKAGFWVKVRRGLYFDRHYQVSNFLAEERKEQRRKKAQARDLQRKAAIADKAAAISHKAASVVKEATE